jgi:hypothetical protein
VDVPQPVINTSQSYTVSAWVKLNSTTGSNQTFASIDGSSISPFYLQLESGVFSFALRSSDSTGSTATLVTGLAPTAGTWYQVTGVYNASTSTASLYVNGVLQSSKSFSSAWQANGHTAIGRAQWNGNKVDFVNGAIGDVRMYNKALTSHDVLALGTGAAVYFPFTEGTGTSTANLIQNTAPADFTGDAVWSGSGNPVSNSVSLDGTLGTTAFSPVAAVNTAGSYAVSVWVKFNAISGSSNNTFVSLDGTGGQLSTVSPFYLQLASGKFAFVQRSSNSTSSSATVITGPAASTGTWYNVIAEYNLSTDSASLYVNGSLVGTDSFSSPWAGGSIQFGDAVYGGLQADPTNAEIDDAVFYNRVLTSTEISELVAG